MRMGVPGGHNFRTPNGNPNPYRPQPQTNCISNTADLPANKGNLRNPWTFLLIQRLLAIFFILAPYH